jgi:hypothetical protein
LRWVLFFAPIALVLVLELKRRWAAWGAVVSGTIIIGVFLLAAAAAVWQTAASSLRLALARVYQVVYSSKGRSGIGHAFP